ncbi:unnamed protein product, partial [Ectocarpus sp. 6 AP-2014]
MGLPCLPGVPSEWQETEDFLVPNVGSDDAPERHAWDRGCDISREHEE